MKKKHNNLIVQEFFQAQFELFDIFNVVLEACRLDLENATDQKAYDLSKSIFKDLVNFEQHFSEFDADLWNYVYDVGGAREVIEARALEEGLADHKEYFFRRIENCLKLIEDVATEIQAFEYEWGNVDDLLDRVGKLFDASEAVIEVDPGELDGPEIFGLVEGIPPQRLAPIEVFTTPAHIKRKPPSVAIISGARSALMEAKSALVVIVNEVNEDIRNSNCDIRLKRISSRIKDEISKEYDAFSPITFGINIELLSSFNNLIVEEFGEASAAYLLSAMMQCKVFVRNFRAWNEYIENAGTELLPDSTEVVGLLVEISCHDVFDQQIKDAALYLSDQKKEIGIKNQKLDYAIFQSASNVIGVAIRESLKYLSSLAKKTTKYVVESGERAVGVLALGWVVYNYNKLLIVAENYEFFIWIKPIVEFIKNTIPK